MNLTPSQQRAVETEFRDVLVIAGAGSGKTRVLTQRIVHLLTQRGCSASDLLVLTFTRKAAAELIGRVREAMGDGADEALRGMMIGTFHSIALKILRTDGDKLGYDAKRITIIDPDDSDLLLKQVGNDLGYCNGDKWKAPLSMRKVRQYLDSIYSGTISEAPTPDDLIRIFTEYCARLFSMNALDFGQILRQCSALLRDNPDVLERYQQRFKHVLVDELQDSDAVQYTLHDFFSPPATFFGVGDTRQAIYGFRGSRPDLMVERHPDAEVINLTECFRCGHTIVNAANALIKINKEPLAEPMVGATGREGTCDSKALPTADLPSVVESLKPDYYLLTDMVVLARSHRILKHVAEACQEADMPYYRVGQGFDVCKTDEFRALHAAFRLSENPRDNMAFIRIADLLTSDFPAVRQRAATNGTSLFAALWNMHKGSRGTMAANAQRIGYFHDSPSHSRDMRNASNEMLGGAAIPREVRDFWFEHCKDMTVAQALRWYATRDSQDDIPEGDHLTLMTVHAAKGLEWPCVIIAGCNEGDFPSSMGGPGSIPEERRLFYVAMTRAKELLVTHVAVPSNDKMRVKEPSRFLANAGISPDVHRGKGVEAHGGANTKTV